MTSDEEREHGIGIDGGPADGPRIIEVEQPEPEIVGVEHPEPHIIGEPEDGPEAGSENIEGETGAGD